MFPVDTGRGQRRVVVLPLNGALIGWDGLRISTAQGQVVDTTCNF